MCKQKFAYKFEVQKSVPGTSNFACVHAIHKRYLNDAQIPEFILTLT